MAYHGSGGSYHDSWSPQSQPGQGVGDYPQGSSGYPTRSHTYGQTGSNAQYAAQSQHDRNSSLQYSYTHGAYAGTYPVTSASSIAYSASPTNSYAGSQSSSYGNTSYSQQSPTWAYTQPQTIPTSTYATSPIEYATPLITPQLQVPHPTNTPRLTIPSHPASNAPYNITWPASTPFPATSTSYLPPRTAASSADFTVPCPYECGTVLTGVHAVGNMTRHLKSQNCIGSGRDKTKYVCPMPGCDKRYIRSDGLKVHLRKRHGIAQAGEGGGG